MNRCLDYTQIAPVGGKASHLSSASPMTRSAPISSNAGAETFTFGGNDRDALTKRVLAAFIAKERNP